MIELPYGEEIMTS